MNSVTKSGRVSNIISLSLLGLSLGACEGVDDALAGAPAPADAPLPAAAGEREVTSIVMGPDGQVETTKVRMPESAWQRILALRESGAGDSGQAGARSSSPIDRIQQAQTIVSSCGDSAASLFYSDYQGHGDVVCLKNNGVDGKTSDMSIALNFGVHFYRLGKYGADALICTSRYDCNLYQCGQGSSVWLNAGVCNGHINCEGNVTQPPYQSYMSPYVVHMQPAAPFPCQ